MVIRRQDHLENGEIGAFIVNKKFYLRRIYKDGKVLSLHSENANYPSMSVSEDDEFCIVGKITKIVVDTIKGVKL